MDLLLSPPDNRTPVVASDLEGTLSNCQTWQGMRDYLLSNGHERVYRRFFLRHVPELFLFRMGWIDKRSFMERWLLGLLNLFKDFRRDVFTEMAQWVSENELWFHRRQEVINELYAHREEGRRVIVISGLFEPILAEFVKKLGNFEAIGTPILFEDNLFTGRIQDGLNVGQRKVARLRPFTQNGKIHTAYGDTKRDIPMLKMAKNPVAVYPDARLRETAERNNWRIVSPS